MAFPADRVESKAAAPSVTEPSNASNGFPSNQSNNRRKPLFTMDFDWLFRREAVVNPFRSASVPPVAAGQKLALHCHPLARCSSISFSTEATSSLEARRR
jgi:hypothetical protein